MFIVTMGHRHALASFAVKVEDTAFSTVKSVLPETASHKAQLVLAWELTHAFSHFYGWNIKTRSHHSKHRKAHLLKNNTFIRKRCGIVAIHLASNGREQKSSPQIYKFFSRSSYFCLAVQVSRESIALFATTK